MYENIKCEPRHKYLVIPNRSILRKLKMLGTIVALSSLAAVSFSGCDIIKEGIKEFEKPQTTSYVQQKSETENHIQETSQEAEEYIEQTDIDYGENFIQRMETLGYFSKEQKSELTDEEYNRLLANFNNVIDEKNFSEDANVLIKDIFESLCKNYGSWQNGYIDMPCIKDYINNNFINSVKEISKFEFVDEQSEEGKKRMDNGEAFGTTELDKNGNLIVRIIAKKKQDSSTLEWENTIQKGAHELDGHCKHKEMLYSPVFFANNDELYMLLVEGGGTFHQKFVNPYSTDVYGMWIVSNKDESLEIEYTKDDCIGYLTNLNAYEKLVFLLGYDIMNNAEEGKITFSTIENILSDFYGTENAEEFVETMKNWFMEFNKNWKSDKTYDLSVEFENMFLKLVGLNIEYIKSEEQLERYKTAFKQYVEKNMPRVIDNKENKDITAEVFEYEQVNDLFYKKEEELNKKENVMNDEKLII